MEVIIAISAAILLILILVIWLITSYNGLVNGKMKIENSWSQIDVQLKMRANQIPSLVQVVSAYAKHERETLSGVMEARYRFMSARTPEDAMQSSGEIAGLMGRLFAVAEQYPDLKANQNFMNLQLQLAEIEKKIAMYRQFYNDTVMLYNRRVITFPQNIAAGIFGFRPYMFFQVDEPDRSMPKMNF